jgi:nicotinamidase/pyrazinamidase
MSTTKALLVVDVQNDFCHGSYPVPDGDSVVKPINKVLDYARKHGWKVFASRDWHPKDLFVENKSKAHCVIGSEGAKYHKDLKLDDDVLVISKGKKLSDEHYSAFNGDDISLENQLEKAGIKKIYMAGLATDYCVKNTAIDAAKKGYKTYVFIDGCRAVNKKKGDSGRAISKMRKFGVSVFNSNNIIQGET